MARHFDTQATVPVPERLLIRGGVIEVPGTTASLRVGVERQRIGRAPQCELSLDDSTVSALHAEVQATPLGVRLLDLSSRNGTFLGDVRIVEAYLQGPVELRCGERRLRFVPEAARDILLGAKAQFGALLGTGPEMLSLFATLERFAPSSLSMVIHGETGTGKERVARAIHDASPRRHKPFLAINCAAMPDALLEDELFGHARGAFTGADRDRRGLFVEAEGGTLFFDEVAEMSPGMQAKLLRALENGEVRAMGTERPRKVDVRTLFATHADLHDAVNKKRFREDLFFRIAQVTVEIPPLRRRLEDLPLLIEDILHDLGRSEVMVDQGAMAALCARSWPGNVRELRSFLKVALVGTTGTALQIHDTGPRPVSADTMMFESMTYDEAKREFRRRYYTGLYAACRGNLTQMAKRAGKQRLTVREALREVELDREGDGQEAAGRAGTRTDAPGGSSRSSSWTELDAPGRLRSR